MTEILLHHYDNSPFSEKIRVCLGIKGLSWGAVDQPVIMPKPHLVPLTGGYRRIPVMQIGADIYCDSVLIARELERRYPHPSLFPTGDFGLAEALAYWSDRAVFQAAVAVIFGSLGAHVPEDFVKDRQALTGQPFDPARMAAVVPHMKAQLRAHVAMLEAQLADGRAFLTGVQPGLADANGYYNLWFVRSAFAPAAALYADFAAVAAWYDRVAAIGHGESRAVSPEQALEIARVAAPQADTISPHDAHHLGKPVTAAADDYGRDPISGVLAGSSDHHVAIRRTDESCGEIAVHVPRIGYVISFHD